jgi:hypothetical protein
MRILPRSRPPSAPQLSAFGYANKDELVGKPVTILMPPAEAAAHDGYVDRYEKTGERRVIGKPRGVRMPLPEALPRLVRR